MQYLGQLNDLEVKSRKAVLEGPGDLDFLVRDFEDLYGKVFALAAKSPELGHLLTTVVIAGRVNVEKPLLPKKSIQGKKPPEGARKGKRSVYCQGEWIEAEIFEMDRLHAGNEIEGLAVIEAPSTTLMVPPDRYVFLDEHTIFHMRTTFDQSNR
jgi:N-methylhydantoinase A/oxoprolinase/acetone carboxylase beta subunit